MIVLLLLAAVATSIVIPVMAYKGNGYRGLYLAIAMIGLVAGFGCNAIIPTAYQLANAPNEQAEQGMKVMYEYGAGVCVWLWAFTVGGVIGACLYRKPVSA